MAKFLLKLLKKKKDCSEGGGHSSTETPRQPGPNVSYDTSLPALHSYLGTDLEELSGRTVLDDDSCQTIPLLALPGVVLIPGQTLPLQLFNPSTIEMMIHVINSDRTFGLINSRFSGRTYSSVLAGVGTTAEIRSYRDEEGSYGRTGLRIKAEGRQRFEVLDSRRQSDGVIIGKVRILPELSLSNIGEGSRLNSLDKFKTTSSVNYLSRKETPYSCPLVHRTPFKNNKYDFANYTPFPEFVYKMYDAQVIMKKIRSLLESWNRALRGINLPNNPIEFSYWVAANIPLDDFQRLELIKINEVTQRLRLELKILETCSVLSCRDCLKDIAKREDIFSMSLQGPQGTYVNPNGYVHEAVTVSHASGLQTIGRPSTEQSWFPGYAWTIVECEQCHCHMGWKFTATDKSFKPTKFYGLCRSSIINRLTSSEEVVDPLNLYH
nr:protein cereblon isoform X2 [Parasteatoda tepidariorum]